MLCYTLRETEIQTFIEYLISIFNIKLEDQY